MKKKKPEFDYTIMIFKDGTFSWSFHYHGNLSWWQRLCIQCAGWKVIRKEEERPTVEVVPSPLSREPLEED